MKEILFEMIIYANFKIICFICFYCKIHFIRSTNYSFSILDNLQHMEQTIVTDKTCSSIYGSQIILLIISLPLFELHLQYKTYISRFMHANWRFFASCPSKSIAECRDRHVSSMFGRVTLQVFPPKDWERASHVASIFRTASLERCYLRMYITFHAYTEQNSQFQVFHA